MIIWSGYGLIVIPIVFFSGLSSEWFLEWLMQDDQFYQTHDIIRAGSYLYAAAILFFVGKWLNKNRKAQHSFFFIPVEYWALIMAGISTWIVISSFFKG